LPAWLPRCKISSLSCLWPNANPSRFSRAKPWPSCSELPLGSCHLSHHLLVPRGGGLGRSSTAPVLPSRRLLGRAPTRTRSRRLERPAVASAAASPAQPRHRRGRRAVHVEQRPPGLRRDAERDGEAGGTSGWDRGVSSSAPESPASHSITRPSPPTPPSRWYWYLSTASSPIDESPARLVGWGDWERGSAHQQANCLRLPPEEERSSSGPERSGGRGGPAGGGGCGFVDGMEERGRGRYLCP
jgi:hypothetical protein